MPASAAVVERTAESEDAPALDDLVLARLEAEIGSTGFTQLLDVICSTMMERRVALVAAVVRGDGAAMTNLAHTLKTSSLYVGAGRLAAACVALEAAVHDGAQNVVDIALDIINASKRVSAALAARVALRYSI